MGTGSMRRRVGRAAAALLLALLESSLPAAAADSPTGFTGPQLRRVLAHGPWPEQARVDPSNRLSGDPFAIEFGRRLFFDPMLSSNGYVACASCHQPDRAWTDRRARAQALGPSLRNTPTLLDVARHRWWGWSGASDSLWMATLRPLLDPDEMNSSPELVARRLTRNDDLACRYRRLFGPVADSGDEAILVNVAKAIAAFEETLVSPRTAFDRLREALARGERADDLSYPAAARRGLGLFVGKARCAECHSGPGFSDGRFHATGVALGIAWAPPDPGRADGLRRLRGSRFTLHGIHNDDPKRASAPVPQEGDSPAHGAFRTPGLRSVAQTAPYMHDGSLDTLEAVLRRYVRVGPRAGRAADGTLLRVPALDEREIADLAAFLRTLGDPREPAPRLVGGGEPPCD